MYPECCSGAWLLIAIVLLPSLRAWSRTKSACIGLATGLRASPTAIYSEYSSRPDLNVSPLLTLCTTIRSNAIGHGDSALVVLPSLSSNMSFSRLTLLRNAPSSAIQARRGEEVHGTHSSSCTYLGAFANHCSFSAKCRSIVSASILGRPENPG